MKKSYPVILIPEAKGYSVYIPDFDISTQGDDLTDAIEMARDAIGLMGIHLEDEGKIIPQASELKDIICKDNEMTTLVDIDFAKYRREIQTEIFEVKAIKELCEKYNLKQIELSRRFEIPIRTVQDWYREVRTPPEYVVRMIEKLLILEP